MAKLSIRDLRLEGRRLFLRVDFNVPIEGRLVDDDRRIRACLPTLNFALQKKARIILASHLGRPKGRRQSLFSLEPVASHLTQLIGREVGFVDDCLGQEVEERTHQLKPGEILLLENLRFHAGEGKNDPQFSRVLASWADEYVNDAFGTAHRAHASIVGVPEVLGKGAAGLLMERELDYLSRVLFKPERPVVVVLGGAKISDKIGVMEQLLRLTDEVLLGGGMAFTFLKAQGMDIGRSLCEEDKLEVARKLILLAQSQQVTLKLPVDSVIAKAPKPGVPVRVVEAGKIPEDWMGLDIGPRTVQEFSRTLSRASTIIWNGPLGVFEIDNFAEGTLEIARAIAASRALSVVGGGDSAAAVKKAGGQYQISHISTGGGASLEFLAAKKLPGVEILTDKE